MPLESVRTTYRLSPAVGAVYQLVSDPREALVGGMSSVVLFGFAHTIDVPTMLRKVTDEASNASRSPPTVLTPRRSAGRALIAVRSSRRTVICSLVRWKKRC